MYKLPVVYWVNSILNNTADTLSVRDCGTLSHGHPL